MRAYRFADKLDDLRWWGVIRSSSSSVGGESLGARNNPNPNHNPLPPFSPSLSLPLCVPLPSLPSSSPFLPSLNPSLSLLSLSPPHLSLRLPLLLTPLQLFSLSLHLSPPFLSFRPLSPLPLALHLTPSFTPSPSLTKHFIFFKISLSPQRLLKELISKSFFSMFFSF